jgi:hypothetical protein
MTAEYAGDADPYVKPRDFEAEAAAAAAAVAAEAAAEDAAEPDEQTGAAYN